MRKISANLILPVSSPPIKNGIIRLDNLGYILEVLDTGGKLNEEPGLEFYQGRIVPGFVLPWLRMEHVADSIENLDLELTRNGVKGAGLVLRESMITENTLERMSISPLTYHLIIELCPERGEDAFEVLNRGVELLGLAWNEFNISCSLIPFSPASGSPASGPQTEELEEMKRHIREFNSLHQHVIPPDRDLQNILGQDLPNDLLRILGQEKDFDAVLPAFTLHAAERIFEEDKLGSIDPGKRPGLNLITLPDPHSVQPLAPASLKVLV